MRVSRSMAVGLLLVASLAAGPAGPSAHAQAPSTLLVEPIVKSAGFVGCIATVQIGDLATGLHVATGVRYITPGRLAVDWTSGLILSVQVGTSWFPQHADPPPWFLNRAIVYTMWPRDATHTRWRTGYYYSNRYGITTNGDAAILPREHAFLLSTVRWRPAPADGIDAGIYFLRNVRPFHVRKLAIPPYPERPTDMGEALASFETDGAVAEIELTRDHAIAHVVTDRHVVHSLRTDTLAEVAPPIAIPRITGLVTAYLNTTIGYLRADLSPDDRYLVVNQGRTGKLTLVDLEARTARTLELDPPLAITGGVAINGGWENRWRLAVHAHSRVVVYDLDPLSTAPLREVASAPINPPTLIEPGAVYMAVSWSGKGDKVIAAESGGGAGEGIEVFAVEGNRMERLATDLGCGWHNADIWTRNGELEPSPTPTVTPSPTATPTVTPVLTETPTPTSTPRASATATPSATPTATNTPSPTAEPRPVYIPLALHERCDPTQQRIDVALVIDASTSMNEPTRLGRPKIVATLEAARAFLDLLSLDGPSSDQAAIVAFNAQAQLLAPLTNDRAALEAALDAITLAQQTRLDLAVAAGADALADGTRRRPTNQEVLVLLTDGRANPVPVEAAVEQAALAKAAGITLFTIGLGEDIDAEGLAAMASRSGGFLRAPDAEDLAGAYAEVARSIPCLASAWWGGR